MPGGDPGQARRERQVTPTEKADYDAVLANLTATQERCTQLIQENRALEKRCKRLKDKWLMLLTTPAPEEGEET